MVAKYAIEHWTRIPCEVELASEFRYRDPIVDPRTLIVAISQSGETMDTFDGDAPRPRAGCEKCWRSATRRVHHSRESDAALSRTAGPEIAVASTKAFRPRSSPATSWPCTWLRCGGTSSPTEIRAILTGWRDIPRMVDLVLDTAEPVRQLANGSPDARSVLFIGRHVGFRLRWRCAETQRARLHARGGFAAGELKHGPIALIEDGLPVIVVVPSPRGT